MLSEKNQIGFLPFLVKKLSLRGNIGRFASRFAGGALQRASVASLTLGDKFYLPRDAKQDCNYFQYSYNSETGDLSRERFAGGALSRALVASLMLGSFLYRETRDAKFFRIWNGVPFFCREAREQRNNLMLGFRYLFWKEGRFFRLWI